MSKDDLVAQVKRRMERVGANQRQVASRVGLSQGHLSKILSERIRPGAKTANSLREWIQSGSPADDDPDVRALLNRLVQMHPQGKQKTMQLMHLIADLLERDRNDHP